MTRTISIWPPQRTVIAPVSLLYRASDIPDGFSVLEGARRSSSVSFALTTSEASRHIKSKTLVSPGTFNPGATTAIVSCVTFAMCAVAALYFRIYRKRQLERLVHIGHSPETLAPSFWQTGVIPTLPGILSIPIGIFLIIQTVGFSLRVCATTFAWSIAVDSGWLLLALGMPARYFVSVWNMCAAGGSYG